MSNKIIAVSFFAFIKKINGHLFKPSELILKENVVINEISNTDIFNFDKKYKLQTFSFLNLYPYEYFSNQNLSEDILTQKKMIPDLVEDYSLSLSKKDKETFIIKRLNPIYENDFNQETSLICLPFCVVGKEKDFINAIEDGTDIWNEIPQQYLDFIKSSFEIKEDIESYGIIESNYLTQNFIEAAILADSSRKIEEDSYIIKKFNISDLNIFNSFIMLSKNINLISYITLDDFIAKNKNKIAPNSIEIWLEYQHFIRETLDNMNLNKSHSASIDGSYINNIELLSDIEILQSIPEYNEFDFYVRKNTILSEEKIDNFILYPIQASSEEEDLENVDIDMLMLVGYNSSGFIVDYENIYFVSALGLNNAQDYIVNKCDVLEVEMEVGDASGIPYSFIQNKILPPDLLLEEKANIIIH